ncbi:MAG: type II toxin-antitoxin system VapC family toxin [Candidatus Margulisiibacteriota bacterium]|jgi:hypothetical protein
MKKIKVYLDTSVIGGCFDTEFSIHSNKLINEILENKKIGVISDITIRELSAAPKVVVSFFEKILKHLQILEMTNEIQVLAAQYLKENIVSEKFYEDLLHIAFATVNQIDVLVSWNFKHIVNYQKIILFNAVNLKNGYKELVIYSPREVVENEKDN